MDSGDDVVRNSTRFGPLSVSCKWMFVWDALGSGKATSTGACDASVVVSASAAAIARAEVVMRSRREEARGKFATRRSAYFRTLLSPRFLAGKIGIYTHSSHRSNRYWRELRAVGTLLPD
jgi:hypothetical protein